ETKTSALIDQLPGGVDLKRYIRNSINKLVSQAKNYGMNPECSDEVIRPVLWDLAEFFDIELWGNNAQRIIDMSMRVLRQSAKITSMVDFDDMLWLPVVHKLSFPNVDDLFID